MNRLTPEKTTSIPLVEMSLPAAFLMASDMYHRCVVIPCNAAASDKKQAPDPSIVRALSCGETDHRRQGSCGLSPHQCRCAPLHFTFTHKGMEQWQR
eukprot:607438-Amphidinium_carterae.3